MPADFVAHGISENGRQDHQEDHQPELHGAPAGDDPAQDGSRLARQDESHKQGILGKDKGGNNDVSQQRRNIQNAVHATAHGPENTGIPAGTAAPGAMRRS